MKAREFFELVADMRAAQKAYFRTRSLADLDRAKHDEQAVDDEIKRVRRYLEQNGI